MHFEPSKELKKFIDDCVKSGWYQNQSEVLRTALRRMKREEEERDAVLGNHPNKETLASFEEVKSGKAKRSSFVDFKKEMRELADD